LLDSLLQELFICRKYDGFQVLHHHQKKVKFLSSSLSLILTKKKGKERQ